MSLFSDLTQSALGALTGNAGGTSPTNPLVNLVTEMIGHHSSGNGLAGLLQQFAGAGLGAQASSWVGTGENIPVSGEQVHQALGAEQIAAFAQKLGLPPGQVSGLLAQVLPQVIDHLTPHGQVPQGSGLESALGGLLQSDLLKSLTGPR
jgi:uncharacterized protein YidB (DUF937 family)